MDIVTKTDSPTVEISENQLYISFGPDELLKTPRDGLNGAEVARRLSRFGPNSIANAPKKPLIAQFAANFTHLMAILLWAGGLVGFLAQMPQLGLAIWAVNLINGAFSFWQEYRAGKATEALRKLLPTFATVLREGQETTIPAEEMVPGDIMILSEGNHISADGRLLEENELRVDQSTLTGESRPVRKICQPSNGNNLSPIEKTNLVMAGTSVITGSGRALVLATGMQTQFGKIAQLTQNVADTTSPLQKELNRVTRTITILSVGLGTLFFTLAIMLAGVDLAQSFIFAMGMVVAFVPEGMLPTVTLSLAMGVQRIARRNALVKRLSAVETLGCTTVICTDKTGTLTKNEMTVSDLWVPGHPYSVTGTGYSPDGQLLNDGHPVAAPIIGDLHSMLMGALLCNDAQLVPPDDGTANWKERGDPTEAALEVVAMKGGLDYHEERRRVPRLREIPFDPNRKRMSTVHQKGEKKVAYVKGAPEGILALCNYIQVDNVVIPMTKAWSDQALAVNNEYASSSLRVLAVAGRTLPDSLDWKGCPKAEIEQDLVFLGLAAMMDPPRPEVAEAVARCQAAGIKIIMITGDYELTAQSIANKLGLVKNRACRVITGSQLSKMSKGELTRALQGEVIFARVSPEHKLRVVSTLQDLGNVVAATGDGVNDAPALKKADIGVAMGQAGTDVAKEAADMILTDDNFASIVNAIEEGRAIFSNIRKFAVYVFNSNMAEAVPFIMMLFSRGAIPLPLTVMQVLSIDLGTDMVPAIGLGTELPETGVMNQPPRSLKEPLLTKKLLVKALLWYGLIESVAAISAYFFLNWRFGWPGVPLAAEGTYIYQLATTMTLAGVVATQVGAVFACRTEINSIFKTGFFTNRLVVIGVGTELILLVLLVYAPFSHAIFNTAPLDGLDWLYVFAWTPLILLLDELRKLIKRRRSAKT
jgi:potassium/sodium efflux P-type ATPase